MGQVELKNKDEIALMRDAGRIVSEILDALQTAVAPGITTWDLDGIAEDLIFRKGAKPAFKGYLGFPACLCASVNQEVIHGIPSKKKKLVEGDLIKLDFGVVYKGFYGDSARTVPVGVVSDEAKRLIDTTRESLHQGIGAVQVANLIADIGYPAQTSVQNPAFSVVRHFVGHGFGQEYPEKPPVPNFIHPPP